MSRNAADWLGYGHASYKPAGGFFVLGATYLAGGCGKPCSPRPWPGKPCARGRGGVMMDRRPLPAPVIRFIAPLGCDRMSVQWVSGEPLAMVEYYDRAGV